MALKLLFNIIQYPKSIFNEKYMSTFIPKKSSLEPLNRALDNFRNKKLSSHADSFDRLDPICLPIVKPKFKINGKKPIFAVGSCFARNLEIRLRQMGINIPTFAFPMTHEEYSEADRNIINKYTPASIYNEIKWSIDILKRGDGFRPSDAEKLLFILEDGKAIDLNLKGFFPIDYDRAIARRKALYEYFSKIFEAETVIITLGLIECWWDSSRKVFIEQAPFQKSLLKQTKRFSFYRLKYSEAKKLMLESINLINSVEQKKKILLTTSPVPLIHTFTSEDIITANMHSKSILRAVCGELADEIDTVEYFPSYETVSLTKDWEVFREDKRHVSSSIVSHIITNTVTQCFDNVAENYQKYLQSRKLLEDGQAQSALELIEGVIVQNSQSHFFWQQYANCFNQLNLKESEFDARLHAYNLAPNDENIVAQYCMSLAKTYSSKKAVDIAENYIENYPNSAKVEKALTSIHQLSQEPV